MFYKIKPQWFLFFPWSNNYHKCGYHVENCSSELNKYLTSINNKNDSKGTDTETHSHRCRCRVAVYLHWTLLLAISSTVKWVYAEWQLCEQYTLWVVPIQNVHVHVLVDGWIQIVLCSVQYDHLKFSPISLLALHCIALRLSQFQFGFFFIHSHCAKCVFLYSLVFFS